MRSKTDGSQLNLAHGEPEKNKEEKLKIKTDRSMLIRNGPVNRESAESLL